MFSYDYAFLDSGTGGIPYMLELKKKEPNSTCVYLGDTAHFPYGQKSLEEVTNCAASSIKLIIEKFAPKAIVIACNTISVTALDNLRTMFPQVPIVGTVPAIKLASKVTKNRTIGLLATNATVNHPYCEKLIQDFAKDCKVVKRGDPDLIAYIEHKMFTATKEEKLEACKEACDFFKEQGCDTVILGCTHFCHMAQEISEVLGPGIQVVDSREGVANQAIRVKKVKENNNGDNICPADMIFYVSACKTEQDEMEYSAMCKKFNIPWGGEI